MLKKSKDEKGITLVLFLALLLMMTLVGVLAVSNSLTNMDISHNRGGNSNLLYSAEAGVEKAFALIKDYYDHNTTPMSSLPADTFLLGKDSVGYYTFCDSAGTLGGWCSEWLTTWRRVAAPPAFRGISARAMGYLIVSEAWNPTQPKKVSIKQQVAAYHIPVYAFAAFYDTLNLEIAPQVSVAGFIPYSIEGQGGAGIHSNKDIYIESPSDLIGPARLRLRGRVTAKGAIYHGHDTTTYKGSWPGIPPIWSWGSSDSIYIIDAVGTDRPMKDASGWLDHNSTDWVQNSLGRWMGTVEDSAHKISGLNLQMVLPVSHTPRHLIYRASQSSSSLENSAYLKIFTHIFKTTTTDSAVCYNTGTWTNCKAGLFDTMFTGDYVVKKQRIFDYREYDTVICYTLDMGRLAQTAYYPNNGLIYISRDTNYADPFPPPSVGKMKAVMITNATTLPRATTIVSDKPIYILGDFNTTGGALHPPAAIIADAVTILSGATDPTLWAMKGEYGDSTEYYDNDTIARRSAGAGPITVNACIMAGNRATTSSSYSGGIGNLARLMEDWNGVRLNLNGSLSCFWRSTVATANARFPNGSGVGTDGYYRSPYLYLFYDATLTSDSTTMQPPGAPWINLTVKTKRSVEEL